MNLIMLYIINGCVQLNDKHIQTIFAIYNIKIQLALAEIWTNWLNYC